MFKRFLLVLLLSLNLMGVAQAARPLPVPQLLAVYVTADWCPNCKVLGPNLQQAIENGGLLQKPVLFVTLNLTDKPHIRQALLMAQALGIGPWLQSQGSATGYVALLNAQTKKEVARFDKTHKPESIEMGIKKLLELK